MPFTEIPRTLEALHAAVAGMLGEPVGNVGVDDDLIVDWGLDSMLVMAFVERLRAAGADIGIIELAERPTIAAWSALLARRLPVPDA